MSQLPTGSRDPRPARSAVDDRIAELEKALEAKKTQHGETLGMLEQAYTEIESMRVALEASQRPPLGYIVVTKAEGRGPFVHGDHRLVMASQSDAIASVGRSDLPRGMTHVVAEVREIAP